ncbi:G-type lectin S-receptor-like serine/threonine-protein kinase [Iris pallida]|uniref:Receptor-like serine/threonine-protein kinase n=1 Tax=Iris pallida TaxID=29817 RepID=A0AAX6H787_IRIPA|nr:G-type lectin S-receptor-like serine/threonine-protein kinase [Iris pallida]
MGARNTTCFFFLLLCIFLSTGPSIASDVLSHGQSLSGNQTLVSRQGNFELGFFTPGNSSSNYYIGIWYKKLQPQTIIWVANRESPVASPSNSKLTISATGDLVLLNHDNTPIWSSNSNLSSAGSYLAILLDNGNLAVTNGSDSGLYLWQSFAHPTDTWMPGGWLGVDKITGEYQRLTSWKNSDDPAPGLFSQSMDPDGSNQYVILWNRTDIYWSSGLWNGQFFSAVPGTKESTAFNFTFIDDKDRKFASYTILDNNVITRYVVDSSGQGRQWYLFASSQKWTTVFTQPLDQCTVYSLCGNFGVCDDKNPTVCSCPDGFHPTKVQEWDLNDWSSGCSRRTQLKCGDGDGFLKMVNMRLPANLEKLMIGSDKGCELACKNNCSCHAYSYGSAGCSVWKGEVRNLQQRHDGDGGGDTLFLRLVASDIPSSSNSHRRTLAVTLGVVLSAVVLVGAAIVIAWAYRRRKQTRASEQAAEGSVIRFSYSTLQRMTKNFSDKVGTGGFGSVFKGVMPNSTLIAVKKLEGLRQGEKQFRTEVSTLGAVGHVNLVRLCGYCCERSQMLLVYEYMSGGSLDAHLFHDGCTFLNWRTRYQIILGTARGLAYLHEKCRECIIHCDVKPDNILLDEEFCPKVSDFGMAKLLGRDFSRVLTTMRGTVGYLAPEWISGSPITPKVDVYSFGMMLFEVVSGSRNTRSSEEEGDHSFYPSWAAREVIQGNAMRLLDPKLEGVAEAEEVNNVCKVAIWCIQDSEERRPSMGQVVQILEGVLDVNMPPLPAALQNLFPQDQDQDPIRHSQREEEQDSIVAPEGST